MPGDDRVETADVKPVTVGTGHTWRSVALDHTKGGYNTVLTHDLDSCAGVCATSPPSSLEFDSQLNRSSDESSVSQVEHRPDDLQISTTKA